MTPYKRGSRWWGRVDGKRVPLGEGITTKAQAERLEAELKVRADRQSRGLEPLTRNPQKHTVASLLSWHLVKIAKTKSAVEIGRTMRKHVVDDFAALDLARVHPAEVNNWLDEREATGISGATVNRIRAYLMGAFTRAIGAGLYVGQNPVKATRKRTEDRRVDPPLPATSVRPLIENAPNTLWAKAFALAAYAGMRRSEIARLRWVDVDLDGGVIYVRQTKASRDRIVPIHDELRPFLAHKRDGVVIDRKEWGHSAVVVRKALERAGIVDEEACFKALRSAWASRWVDCGAPPNVVEWVGWGPRHNSVMERHYLRYPTATLQAEMAKLSWPTTATVLQMKGAM
jgi:hypothetical protein